MAAGILNEIVDLAVGVLTFSHCAQPHVRAIKLTQARPADGCGC